MTANLAQTAGIAITAKFASSSLRRACVLHRASRLAICSAVPVATCLKHRERRYATAVSNAHSAQEDALDRRPDSKQNYRSTEVNQNSFGKGRDDSSELDPYLPLELRSGTWLENLANFEGVRNPSTLPARILDLNPAFPSGVLTHIALSKYRWSAFLYLATALVRTKTDQHAEFTTSGDGSPWEYVDMSFPDLGAFDGHVDFAHAASAKDDPLGMQATNSDQQSSLDPTNMLSNVSKVVEGAAGFATAHQQAMGYLWQSLGQIVIGSLTHDQDYAEYMMTFVQRILAVIHHENTLPPNLYHYDSPAVSEVIRKPPYLHIMSARFFGAMAAASWKAQESKVIPFYDLLKEHDAKSDGPRIFDDTPAVRPIGAETWIELILWSCIHGNHMDAVGAILKDMMASNAQGQRWSAIPWQSLLATAVEGGSDVEAKALRDRFDRVAGEALSDEPPIVSLPARTVSSEVLAATIDNLTLSNSKNGLREIIDLIRPLATLLKGSDSAAMQTYWHMLLVRLLNNADPLPDALPAYTDALADFLSQTSFLNRNECQTKDSQDLPSLMGNPVEITRHRAMAGFLAVDNLDNALDVYSRLRLWIQKTQRSDSQVRTDVSSPPSEIETPGREMLDKAPKKATEVRESDVELPTTTLALLLEAILKHGVPRLAQWMVTGTNLGRPIINDAHFASPVLQPLLIRLGIVHGDQKVLLKVANHVSAIENTDPSTVQALLHAQISLSRFRSAESVFALMQRRGIEPSNLDVLWLARAIIQLHTGELTGGKPDSLSNALALLGRVLHRQYSRPAQPYSEPDYAVYRRMNQLRRILASVSDHLFPAKVRGTIAASGQASGPSPMATTDFHVLLEAVVKAQGPVMARALVDKWCRSPGSVQSQVLDAAPSAYLPLVGVGEPDPDACVDIKPLTVQIIMRPIIRAVCEKREKEQSGRLVMRQDDLEMAAEALSRMKGEMEKDPPSFDNKPRAVEALPKGKALAVKPKLPLDPGEYQVIQWAGEKLLALGWTPEWTIRKMPEIFDIVDTTGETPSTGRERLVDDPQWRYVLNH